MAAAIAAPLAPLAARRFQLMVRTPRELFVPLLTPLLFALVIAPALKAALHTSTHYEAYVALGTVGLLIPLNSLFSGLSVIVDRESGAQRELLAAPVARPVLVIANVIVALARQQGPAAGGVHRSRAGDRDRPVVHRRRAVPDQRAPHGARMDSEVPAAHARARADPLRDAGRRARAPQRVGQR